MAAPSPAEIQHQKEHIHENRSPDIIASHKICFVLACIAVILRFISRRVGKNPIKADDWLIVAALVSQAQLSTTASVMILRSLIVLPIVFHCCCDVGQLHISAFWSRKALNPNQEPGWDCPGEDPLFNLLEVGMLTALMVDNYCRRSDS